MILPPSLSIVAFAASGLLSASLASALEVPNTVRRATDFAFDLFSGPTLQDDTSAKSPSQLDYTTGGGVP
jgi:hypothetical protein